MISLPRAVRRGLVLALVGLAGVTGYGMLVDGGTAAPSSTVPSPASSALAPRDDCQAVLFQDQRFTQCIAVPGRHRIETRLSGADGVIFRGFAGLARALDAEKIAFAVNGGMYDFGSRPIGYYVEDGERRMPLNRNDGPGNFHLKPNGVFFGDAEGNWRVMTSDDFAANVSKRPAFGTQSGPMLLIGGKLHPRISPAGTSLKFRNAVGVDREGQAHFVLSEDPVSFGAMAAFMRDRAGTPDALFLDGTVSSLWHPSSGRMDAGYPLGPLIVVSALRKGTP